MKKLSKNPGNVRNKTIASYADCSCLSRCFCACYSTGGPYEYRTPENISFNDNYSDQYRRN
ncbi:hypothetical protein AALD01_09725 [Oscillospiraceae bacterium 21-37]